MSIVMAVILPGIAVSMVLGGGAGPAHAERLYQEPTAYPAYPTAGYPVVTDTAPVFPTPTLETGQPSPFPTLTLTLTATIPPNTLLTENAEMQGGKVTPPASETPGPTITAYASPTPTLETPLPVAAAAPKSGSRLNWGLFWLGFSLPVLAACGWVLYLLDRRPDLFRPRSKPQP